MAQGGFSLSIQSLDEHVSDKSSSLVKLSLRNDMELNNFSIYIVTIHPKLCHKTRLDRCAVSLASTSPIRCTYD